MPVGVDGPLLLSDLNAQGELALLRLPAHGFQAAVEQFGKRELQRAQPTPSARPVSRRIAREPTGAGSCSSVRQLRDRLLHQRARNRDHRDQSHSAGEPGCPCPVSGLGEDIT